MSNIELVKAEIERRIAGNSDARARVLSEILTLINSLPEDEPSENIGQLNLEQAVDNYIANVRHFPDDEREIVMEIARHFAGWQKEQMGKQAREKSEIPINQKDLEQAAKNWCKENNKGIALCADGKSHYLAEGMDAFIAGAQWQKEQFEKNRLAACDGMTEEEYKIETEFVDEIILKEHRQPTFIDAIKYGMRLQKEQMLIGWSEDYCEENIGTRFAFYTYKDEPFTLYLSNVFVEKTSRNRGYGTQILKAAERVAETVGADTIRLKVKQDSPANAWYRKHGYEYTTFEDGYDWLAKTRITQFKED